MTASKTAHPNEGSVSSVSGDGAAPQPTEGSMHKRFTFLSLWAFFLAGTAGVGTIHLTPDTQNVDGSVVGSNCRFIIPGGHWWRAPSFGLGLCPECRRRSVYRVLHGRVRQHMAHCSRTIPLGGGNGAQGVEDRDGLVQCLGAFIDEYLVIPECSFRWGTVAASLRQSRPRELHSSTVADLHGETCCPAPELPRLG